MRKTLLILAGVVLLYAAACSKKNGPSTDVPLPASLQKMIAQDTNCTCSPYLKEYVWRNQVVYLQGCAGTACNCFSLYYTAEGEPIEMPAGYTVDNFLAEAPLVKIVWSCGQ